MTRIGIVCEWRHDERHASEHSHTLVIQELDACLRVLSALKLLLQAANLLQSSAPLLCFADLCTPSSYQCCLCPPRDWPSTAF